MKRVIFGVLVLLAVAAGYFLARLYPDNIIPEEPKPKKAILRVAMVTDSHNDNELLGKALSQAQGMGVNFVIGLGDYSNVGTVDELKAAKDIFEKSGLGYYVTLGDRDEWASRNAGDEATGNFADIFGPLTQTFDQSGVRFVIIDNSDIYKGMGSSDWENLGSTLTGPVSSFLPASAPTRSGLTFVFAHKTPYHPQSAHIMGEQTEEVSRQARKLMDLLEERKVDGFFSGDLHFFAKYNSPNGSVKMATIGAVTRAPNPQGPRFGVLTVYEDDSWQVDDVEIR